MNLKKSKICERDKNNKRWVAEVNNKNSGESYKIETSEKNKVVFRRRRSGKPEEEWTWNKPEEELGKTMNWWC